MERLIASIDDILKGENKMDFSVFSKTEIEEMFQTMVEHMPEDMKNIAIKEFGSVEQWKAHYIEAALPGYEHFTFLQVSHRYASSGGGFFPLSGNILFTQYPLHYPVPILQITPHIYRYLHT